MHGRTEDLARIDSTLAAATAGRCNAVFFTGEPGIGKSMIAETRARASSHTVLAGVAWEASGAPPYWLWQQVLRDAAGHFGARVASLSGADRIAELHFNRRTAGDAGVNRKGRPCARPTSRAPF